MTIIQNSIWPVRLKADKAGYVAGWKVLRKGPHPIELLRQLTRPDGRGQCDPNALQSLYRSARFAWNKGEWHDAEGLNIYSHAGIYVFLKARSARRYAERDRYVGTGFVLAHGVFHRSDVLQKGRTAFGPCVRLRRFYLSETSAL